MVVNVYNMISLSDCFYALSYNVGELNKQIVMYSFGKISLETLRVGWINTKISILLIPTSSFEDCF